MLPRQQSLDRNIFVDLFPMDANTPANKSPSAPLCPRGLVQPGEPMERDEDLSTVGQDHAQDAGCNAHLGGKRLRLHSRSIHPISPGTFPDLVPLAGGDEFDPFAENEQTRPTALRVVARTSQRTQHAPHEYEAVR